MTTNPNPWNQYWTHIGNEDWLTARRPLDLSPRVTGYYACYLAPSPADDDRHSCADEDGGHERTRRLSELELDWPSAASRIDAEGFSSTERRLARLVAALTTGQPLDLQDLSRLGSWRLPVWATLVEWGTDGAATLHPAHCTSRGENAPQAGGR